MPRNTNRLSIWYAFWAISINLVFRGQSTEYFGQMAVTMNNWELAEIFIGFLVGLAFFLPGVRLKFDVEVTTR